MPKCREKWAPTVHLLMHCQVCSCMPKRSIDIMLWLYSGTLVLPWARRDFSLGMEACCTVLIGSTQPFFFVRALTSALTFCKGINIENRGLHQNAYKQYVKKNALYSRFIKSKSKVDWKLFRTQRNRTNSLLRRSKKLYFENLFNSDAVGRPDIIWKNLNSLLNRSRSQDSVTSDITMNGKLVSGTELSDKFNDFFTSIGTAHITQTACITCPLEHLILRTCIL